MKTRTCAAPLASAASADNNAPARLPDGLTLVEWTFDDYLGNVASHTQKVIVVPPALYPPPRSWVWGSLHVPVGGGQTLFYGTAAQGTAMRADEYLLLLLPSGELVSFDPDDRVSERGLVPHTRRAETFGVQGSFGWLRLDPFQRRFPDGGVYLFSHLLVRPGGSPLQPGDIVALEWWPFFSQGL